MTEQQALKHSWIDAAMAEAFASMRGAAVVVAMDSGSTRARVEPDYDATIAETFIRLRGRSLTLSPLDTVQIQQWRDAGIPLRVVLAAVEEVMGNHRGKRVRSISYCAGEVEARHAEYLELRTGANE